MQRGLVGEIIGRFERKGFTLRALRLRNVPRELAEEHYKDLRERPFFPDLVNYITSGPVVAMVGDSAQPQAVALAIKCVLKLCSPWSKNGGYATALLFVAASPLLHLKAVFKVVHKTSHGMACG